MKKHLLATTFLLLPAMAAAQTTLRYADYSANRGIRAEGVMAFLAEVEKRSEGRIKIEQHWAQALLPAAEILDGVINGVASLGTVSAVYTPDDVFAYSVGDLPITNPHEVAGSMAMYELATTHPALVAEFDDLGVVFLMNYSVGPIQMVCKGDAPATIEGFKGKKIRATSNYGKIYGTFGAVNVPLALPEAYSGLDTGLIDCSQAYGYVVESYKLQEVADSFVVIDGATIQSNAMVISRREFDALTPADQKMLVDLGKEYTRKGAEAMRARNLSVIEQLAGGGLNGHKLQVVRFTDDDRAKLEAAGKPFIDDYIAQGAKRGIDAAKLVEDYKALLAKHMAEVKG